MFSLHFLLYLFVARSCSCLAALLGASPGASTAVSIMLDVLQKCFPEKIKSQEWQTKLKEMIPTYGQSLVKDAALCRSIRSQTAKVLKLEDAYFSAVFPDQKVQQA